MSPNSLSRAATLCVLSLALAACSGEQPSAPELQEVRAGKGNGGGPSGGGSGDPTVEDTDPGSAPQDTTLDVRVFGTNFDDGSRVDLLLDGNTTRKVTTNSTTFVNGGELIANITIAADADPDLYDVQVTTSRKKKGIGIEMFHITGPTASLDPKDAFSPAGLYGDGKGPYVGWFNVNLKSSLDEGNFNVRAECEEARRFDLELPKDADGNDLWTFSGPRSDCDFARFHVPTLLNAECPDGETCPIGEPAPTGSNYSPTVYYYFAVDANNDGSFESKRFADERYNVVWTDARFGVVARGTDDVSCAWRVTASTADLWKRDDILIEPTGQGVALDATIRRDDGPCAGLGGVLPVQ